MNMSGRRRQGRRLRGRSAACALALAGLLSACTASFDFERARRYLERTPKPTLPTLQEGPAAEDLPPPEGLRAVSGELRKIPLKWNPVLADDVGGYLVERAPTRTGSFEQLAPIAGALSTTYIDHITSAPQEPTVAGASGDVAAPAPQDAVAADAGEGAEAEETSAGAEISESETGPPDDSEAGPGASSPDGVTYFYRVRAFTPEGQLAFWTSGVVAATTAAAPAPPEDVRAFSHQPRKVPLSWRAPEDPTVSGYRVARSPTEGGPFEPVAQVEGRHATTYVDQGLGDLREFYYQVTSLNAAGGEGAPSKPPVQAHTKAEPLPPIDLEVLESRLGSNRLAWEPNVEPDIALYRLLRLREGADEPEIVTTVSRDSLAARDTAVGAGETVTYSVVAFDADGLESAPGHGVRVESEGYGLSAEVRSDGVHLTWNPRTEEGHRGARIFRRSRLSRREFPPVTGSRFVDADVKPGQSYRYSVALVTADGSSAPRSAPFEVRVPGE
jgi:fibronectin type 3 domain-containing protein